MPKTLFNSSESSNFILNLKENSIKKYAEYSIIVMLILLTISEIIPEFISGLYSLPVMVLIIAGVSAIILLLIVLLKKIITRSQIVPLAILACLCILAIISLLHSFDYTMAFSGQDGRYDGLLSFLCYIGIFFTATLINDNEKIKKLFDTLVIIGLVQCLFAILQSISILDFPSYYKNLFALQMTDAFLPSGLAGSPIFFSAFLTILSGIAIPVILFETAPKRRKLYIISLCIFSFLAIKTQTLVGIIGLTAVFIIGIIIALVKKADKKNLVTMIISITIPAGICFGLIFIIRGKYNLYDGAVMWQDSYYRLGSSGIYRPKTATFDIASLREVYNYTFGKAIAIIKKYPLLGTGPDCFIYTQYTINNIINLTYNTFDRVYNEYLFIAATKGIPYLVVYISFLAVCLKQAFKSIKTDYISLSLITAIIGYIIISFLCVGSITITPIFWLLLGLTYRKIVD